MTRMLENIERHLERVRTIDEAGIPDAGVGPDHRHHQAALIAMFEAAEVGGVAVDTLSANLGDWLGRYLEPLVDELHWALLAGFGGQFDAAARRRLIDWTIAQKSGLARFSKHPAPSQTMRSWLEHLTARELESPRAWYPWQLASRYCQRLGLVTSPPESPRLRMPGHTWLRLRGLDRLRWLLALETVQAVGDDDPWCASPAQFAGILRNVGRFFDDDDDDRSGVPEWSGVERWISLGVLVGYWDDEFGASYRLSQCGEQLLGRQEPDVLELFENLARAQAHDDRSEALGDGRLVGPNDSELAATTMRHARLVAHEVRNALLPVRHALDKVWRAIDDTDTAKTLIEPREQIEQGITRLYQFVEASTRMSEPISEPPATFLVVEAIEQARLALPELSGVRIATIPGTANPRCRGHRGRFVLVLLNLMRNAVQVAGPGVALTISVDAGSSGTTTISIEDDGPGIPEHLRERLFEPGISNRAEGSGHGLALVREVVERELGGTITYESAERGGARFRLGLPCVS